MGLSVSDFTIDNASGQSVRLDIQACLKALQGQSAESSDITTQSQCVAGMTFLNTSTKYVLFSNFGIWNLLPRLFCVWAYDDPPNLK